MFTFLQRLPIPSIWISELSVSVKISTSISPFISRLLENRLGQQAEKRVPYEQKAYHTKLEPEHQKLVQESEKQISLFQVIEHWLERTPVDSIGSTQKKKIACKMKIFIQTVHLDL